MITVERVEGRVAFRRFFELPYVLHRDEPRWSPPPLAEERASLDPQRNPFFDTGDGVYVVARRDGTVAGRLTAHIAREDSPDGWFGFYDTLDDAGLAAALIDHAVDWLRDRGCQSIEGPASFTPEDGPGVLVHGFDVAGTTGRPWNPPWYAPYLEAAGLEVAPTSEYKTWRLTTNPSQLGVISGPIGPDMTPSSKGVGERVVVDGVEAVADLTPARNSARELARRAKRHDWDGLTVVRVEGDAATQIPRIVAAAGAAGYQWVVAPWSPDPGAPPETVHRRYRRSI